MAIWLTLGAANVCISLPCMYCRDVKFHEILIHRGGQKQSQSLYVHEAQTNSSMSTLWPWCDSVTLTFDLLISRLYVAWEITLFTVSFQSSFFELQWVTDRQTDKVRPRGRRVGESLADIVSIKRWDKIMTKWSGVSCSRPVFQRLSTQQFGSTFQERDTSTSWQEIRIQTTPRYATYVLLTT